MKHTALLIWGLALLPLAAQADQTPVSICVEALEQLKTLHMAAPVYKLNEGQHLHVARSPGCMGDRDTLSTMEKPESRTPEDDLGRHRKRVAARCPDVDLSKVWLLLGVPVT